MDSDFSQKLNSLLSDPAAVSRISAIAGSLSGGNRADLPTNGETEQSTPLQEPSLPAVKPETGRDPRVALLYALKPLLREESRGKVDNLARAIAVIDLFKTTRK